MKKLLFSYLLMAVCLNFGWAQSEADTSDESIYRFVEVMPEYPGGTDAMNIFLVHHIEYPEAARNHHIQGTILVEFVIEKDGAVSNVTVKNSVHPLLDSAAVKAVRQFSNWKPATNQGNAVRSYFTIPITFQLPDDDFEQDVVPMTKKEARKAAKLGRRLR